MVKPRLGAENIPRPCVAQLRSVPPAPYRGNIEDVVVSPCERAADQGLELGAETNLLEWDGNVVNYDWAVGAMIGIG
jgi:hypothetical protein